MTVGIAGVVILSTQLMGIYNERHNNDGVTIEEDTVSNKEDTDYDDEDDSEEQDSDDVDEDSLTTK